MLYKIIGGDFWLLLLLRFCVLEGDCCKAYECIRGTFCKKLNCSFVGIMVVKLFCFA